LRIRSLADCTIGTLESSIRKRQLIFGEAHLRQILSSYAAYYNEVRTHLALGKDAPAGRAVQRSGTIVAPNLVRAASPLRPDIIFGKDIANSRLIAFDQEGVTFRWKDYRIEGRDRYKLMTLATDEFIRRFLIHVLPKGFHRIRHYGLFARAAGTNNIARARELLDLASRQAKPADNTEPETSSHPCPCCGGRMVIIETFARGSTPRHRPTTPTIAIRIDTSRQRPSHDPAVPLTFSAGRQPASAALAQTYSCPSKLSENLHRPRQPSAR
jgi:Putative transposase